MVRTIGYIVVVGVRLRQCARKVAVSIRSRAFRVVNEVPGGQRLTKCSDNDVIIELNGSPAVSAGDEWIKVAEIRPGSIIPVRVMQRPRS